MPQKALEFRYNSIRLSETIKAFREDIHQNEQLGRPPEVYTILPEFTLPKTLGADSSSPIKTYSNYGSYRHFDLNDFVEIGLKKPILFSKRAFDFIREIHIQVTLSS